MHYCVLFKYTVGGCRESRNEIKRWKRRLTEEDDPSSYRNAKKQLYFVFCELSLFPVMHHEYFC